MISKASLIHGLLFVSCRLNGSQKEFNSQRFPVESVNTFNCYFTPSFHGFCSLSLILTYAMLVRASFLRGNKYSRLWYKLAWRQTKQLDGKRMRMIVRYRKTYLFLNIYLSHAVLLLTRRSWADWVIFIRSLTEPRDWFWTTKVFWQMKRQTPKALRQIEVRPSPRRFPSFSVMGIVLRNRSRWINNKRKFIFHQPRWIDEQLKLLFRLDGF